MPLKQILEGFAINSGFDIDSQRAIMLQQINSAAKELYEFTDLPGCLREVTVMAPAGSIIALPYFVGDLRAMREKYSRTKILLNEMAPRYSYQPWKEDWSNWRVLTKSPIKTSITVATPPIRLTIPAVEEEIVVVNIEGQTVNSNRITESLAFAVGETEIEATNEFTDIFSITKEATCVNDITVLSQDSDAEDVTLAVIPNDRLSALYTMVDVSALPYGGDNGTSLRYVDVLYKQPLNTLTNDGDTFPCDGFDDAIVYKALELEAAVKEDGQSTALAWYRKCEQIMNQRTNHTNGATQKQLVMAPNQYLNLYPRYNYRYNYNRRINQ